VTNEEIAEQLKRLEARVARQRAALARTMEELEMLKQQVVQAKKDSDKVIGAHEAPEQ
jgi:hypothetical protein